MLREIIIKNVKSIDCCDIDFEKGSYKFGEENVVDDCVNPIAIYGHNGSGKTSFFAAIMNFIRLFNYPVESLTPFEVNFFRFQKYSKSMNEDDITGSVEIRFDLGGEELIYFLSTSRAGYIRHEYLKEKKIIFERFKDFYETKGKKIKIDSTSSPLVPLLRSLNFNSNEETSLIKKAFAYLSSFSFLNLPLINSGRGFIVSKFFSNVNYLDLLSDKSEEVKGLLSKYKGFPIYSVLKNEDNNENLNNINDPLSKYKLIIEDGEGFKGELPLETMSNGMKINGALLSVLLTIPNFGVLFIDEIETALHPTAIEAFLSIVREKKIQLVFSSHNTHLLQLFRPDQIYFAKWERGFSHYYRLSKIYPNIREVNNIEKMYLSSVFDEALNDAK